MKKNTSRLIITTFILLWAYLGSGCVPIEDRFDPIISPFAIEDSYFLSDTLRLQTNISDNAGLERIEVEIRPRESNPDAWQEFFVIENIRSRRYALDTFFVVPVDANLDPYQVSIVVYDLSGKVVEARRNFVIVGDVRAPRFFEAQITNLTRQEDESYLACRLSPILLSGYLKDNIGISEVRAQLENFPPIVRVVQGLDSISLSDLFNDRIIIPDVVENGTTLQLRIQATDTDGNLSEPLLFDILVDCDDTAPILEINETLPALGSDNTANVVEGTSFFITDAVANDVGTLDSLFIFFGKIDATPVLIESRALDVPEDTSLDLQTLFDEEQIEIPLPENARVGERYRLTLSLKDEGGNFSDPYHIILIVTKDQPPVIALSNIFIQFQSQIIQNIEEFDQEIEMRSNQQARIEGKLLDDLGIAQVQIDWGVVGNQERIVNLEEADLLIGDELPQIIDFSNANITKVFTPESSPTGATQNYLLTLTVTDSKGQVTRQSYRFKVTP
ncbi:hypothetical protein [Hugenholtzia roseola]|uniref:hypothetical protein n=1 Tax=Hugenholtzia roseola TaxID=1002 RepID=UPI0003F7DBB9|nr:hypothetical protein [Hugenholtzia roseola]